MSNWPFPTNAKKVAENEVSSNVHESADLKLPDPSIPASEKQRLWLFTRIRHLIADHLYVSDNDISEATDFKNDLGADSLDLIEIVMAVEDEFEVEISDDVADTIYTINDAIPILHESLSRQSSRIARQYQAFA